MRELSAAQPCTLADGAATRPGPLRANRSRALRSELSPARDFVTYDREDVLDATVDGSDPPLVDLLQGKSYNQPSMTASFRLFGTFFAVFLVASTAVPHVGARAADLLAADPVTCEDMDCLIQQAQDCSPADFMDTRELNLTPLAPVVQSTTAAYHVEPADGDSCSFALSYPSNHVRYTDEFVAKALADGMTQAELEGAQAHLAEQGTHLTKLHFNCTMAPDDLVATLTRWQAGSFSSNDLGEPQCVQQMD